MYIFLRELHSMVSMVFNSFLKSLNGSPESQFFVSEDTKLNLLQVSIRRRSFYFVNLYSIVNFSIKRDQLEIQLNLRLIRASLL